MTDNPEPKGKGISTRFSNILRRSTRSTSDLTGIHEHDIASDYPTVRKVIKKPKNNDSNDSISIYASDDSDKKPRKIANVPNRKPVYKNPFSAIPSGGTQEAVANALAETDRISDYTLSPPPLFLSSQARREALSSQTQASHWSSAPHKSQNRLPDNEALERCIKYYTITNQAIANIIENRQLYDDTDEEKNSTNSFIQKIEKLGNQISSIAENALYNGTEAGPSRPESPMKQDEEEDTYMGEPEPGPNQPNPLTTEICWGSDAKPGEWGGYTSQPAPTHPATTDPTHSMLQAILTKMGQLDDIKSRLDKLEGKSPQVHTAQASTSRNKHTPNPSPAPTVNPSQTRPSFANVAAKAPAKAPEVKASNIAAAIKRDIAKPAPAQSDDKNFVVRFKTLPVTQPNPESIFVAMRECLDAANRNLGKGRLTRVRWSLKASLHLSFSNNVSITAIENAIPLLMDRLRLPEYEFGPEVPWSRLVVTNVPTGMGGSLQRMRNREELTQLLNEAFPDSAKFGSVKLTLAPDWLADPRDYKPRDAMPLLKCEIKKFNPKPLLQTCSKCVRYGHTERQCRTKNHAATNADVTTTQPKNTTRTTALAVSVTAKATRANASTARPAASTAIVSIPRLPKMSEFRRPITQIVANRSANRND
ncbi:hypothetical protein RHS01_02560 [Rhizoctonia solani]|uniref:Uncharacterized protein n=1 Tax=Rhizoctonia solani TaxID=456999 RepID=A0A8H7ILS5_9AGAM|nr:hypothetical protein RHS01_02560 [Rhizoctonia solani]